jgi:diguanylate cyclase (GGDEF)-like protein
MDIAIQMLRRRGPFAIHFIDLDEFKQVNDTLGHPGGDQLLCAAARRLRELVRDTDIIARFGGDEFVVLQYPLGSQKDAAALAERVVESLAVPFDVNGNKVVIGGSVGIALAPRDGVDADHLLQKADMALYRAKSDGRSAWRFFEPGMDVKAQARRAIHVRGAAALAASRARHDFPGGIHSSSRGNGPDRRDRRHGAREGMHGMRALAR